MFRPKLGRLGLPQTPSMRAAEINILAVCEKYELQCTPVRNEGRNIKPTESIYNPADSPSN